MASIVYGSGTYTMQRFTPSELGLFDSSFEGYEFSIVRKYAHLYWLPLFPIGTLYAVKKPGEKDKYEVTDPSLISMMQEHKMPFWKHLGGFALPLIAVAGFFLYNANERFEDYKSEKAYSVQMEETKQIIADTAALRPAANQFKNLLNCLELTELEKLPKVRKIDTSSTKLLMLLLDCMTAKRDTNILYTKENTFICSPKISYLDEKKETEEFQSNLILKHKDWFIYNNLSSVAVLNWYNTNFTEKLADVQSYDLKPINVVLDRLKYFAKANTIGFVRPSFDKKANRFHSGYVLIQTVVYEIETSKIVDKFDMLFGSSESISFSSHGEIDSKEEIDNRLEHDLIGNFHEELMMSLRITDREKSKKKEK